MTDPMKKKILVIDDELEIAMVIRSRLESAGYEVDEAHSGREGLEKIESYDPDLIILDVMMEDFSGYEVCAEIKTDSKHSNVPVIMFTSRVRVIDEKLSYLCKADAYVRKPQSCELLLPAIEELINKL